MKKIKKRLFSGLFGLLRWFLDESDVFFWGFLRGFWGFSTSPRVLLIFISSLCGKAEKQSELILNLIKDQELKKPYKSRV